MKEIALFTKKYIDHLLVALFAFFAFFVLIRVAILGSHTAQGIFEILIATLPELSLISILILVLISNLGKIKFTLIDKVVLFYFILNTVLGTFLAHNLTMAIFGFRLTYFPMLAYFIVRFHYDFKTNVDSFSRIMNRISLVFICAGVISLLLYFVLTDLEQYFLNLANGKISYYYLRRMGGVLLTPVVWGTFCSIISLYLFIVYAQSKKIWALSGFLILWFCMILSVSRGAIIPFYLGWFFIAFTFKWYKPFFISFACSLIIFVFFGLTNPLAFRLVGFVSSSSVQTMQSISSDEAENVIESEDTVLVSNIKNTRAKFWALSIRSFKLKPMGYGLGKSGHVAVKYKSVLKDASDASLYSTDGWYLKLLNETGIVGGITYLVLFLCFSVFFYRNYTIFKSNPLFIFGLTVFACIAIQNIMSNVFDFYAFPVYYWMLLAFTLNLVESKNYGH